MMYIVEIGPTIVTFRKALGLTQEQLALEAQISVGRLRDIEHGTANYTRDTLYRIAGALDIAVWILYVPRQLEDSVILELLYSARKRLGRNSQGAEAV